MPPSLRLPSLSTLRQHRWLRRCVVALGVLLIAWLLGWLALPALAKGPLERWASDRLGRQVSLGKLDFKPWSLELAISDLRVAGLAGQPDQLSVGRIYVDGELQSLLRLAPVADALRVESPMLRLTHLGAGRYDVDDIVARLRTSTPPPKPDAAPARLALYNLALANAGVDFTDHMVQKTHQVRDLVLQVPFISTLPSQREITVEPHLSFTLDGSRFDSTAQGTPFAQTGKNTARLRLESLDLAPYLGYLPADLPVQLLAATLDADLRVDFEQHPKMAVKLSGSVETSKVRLAQPQQGEWLGFDRLKIDLADVRPLEQIVRLSQVELTAPVLRATRDAQGQLNLAQLVPSAASPQNMRPSTPQEQQAAVVANVVPEPGTALTSNPDAAQAPDAPSSAPVAPEGDTPPAPATVTQAPASAPAAGNAPAAKPSPWIVEVAKASVREGVLHWADSATRPAASLQATALTLDVNDIALPFKQPARFEGSLQLPGASARFHGEATAQEAKLDASVENLSLQWAAPYLAQMLAPSLTGLVNGELGLQWAAPAPGVAGTGLTVTAKTLSLDKVALQQGKTALASWNQLLLEGVALPLDQKTVAVDKLTVQRAQVDVERSADGRWMYERWIKADTSAAAQGAVPAPSPAPPAAWQVRIEDLLVDNAAIQFSDQSLQRPVALDLSHLRIQAKKVGTAMSKPEALQVSARVGVPAGQRGSRTEPGRLVYQGTLAAQPLNVAGRLNLSRVPVHALDGYLADHLAIELRRAHAGFQGQINLVQGEQGTALQLAGDVEVEDLRATSTAASTPKTEAQVGEELLAWKSLGLRGLSVSTAPGTATRVEVKETSLVDFFARITINEDGQINLRDIAKTGGNTGAAANAPASTTALAAGAGTPAASAASRPAAAAATSAPATPATAAVDPLAPVLVFGPVNLVNGKVLFSDYFIRPNYSADLSELTGTLSAFSSQASQGEPQLADLELRGRAEGSASLEITGKLNPLAQPLALDITGKVRELELPPLSPYAVKYAGHGIERGKLSVDVNYKILPNGQLTATNRLVLHQLTFGEAVAGAPNSLPVKLAVALLADRQGVIDLDLPISGSLNDPQFSIGPVIGKIIVNLITKALTAPFSLLASALGGGDAMSQVVFAPGSARLSPEAQKNLDKVAQALTDRPSLKMTVTGTASLQAEREGLQREWLQKMVRAAKARVAPGDDTAVTEQEYPELLKAVYRRADFAKPRNLVGLAKDLSVTEMEALLLANQPATEAMAAELAQERGQAIRSYLASRKLPTERLFVGAPKSGTQPGDWTPRAELSLTMQ